MSAELLKRVEKFKSQIFIKTFHESHFKYQGDNISDFANLSNLVDQGSEFNFLLNICVTNVKG